MEQRTNDLNEERTAGFSRRPAERRRGLAAIAAGAALAGAALLHGAAAVRAAPAGAPPAAVTVSHPLVQAVASRAGFVGQFSAVDAVEIRAQVGGTLTEIDFKDGQIVHKGDLLFVIDPRPYQIKFEEARAQLATAEARLALTRAELWRAQQLKQTSFGTAETVDQRRADQDAAAASIDQARAALADAALDLEFCHVTAPFTGRISSHRVSVGNLVSGSRAGTSATTLLTTLVSLDPIYFDFDMSENDFLAYERAHPSGNMPADAVAISLGDEERYTRRGTLDFVDNALDRSSGTIHARATVPNHDLFIKPGEFARIRLQISPPRPATLVPATAVMLDQSQHLVLTVTPDGTVVPRPVEVGELRGNLQVIRAGLSPEDRVIISGLMHAMPGAKVAAENGSIRFDSASD